MDHSDLAIAVALGDEAKKFFNSELGQYVIKASQDDIDGLREQFENLEPTNTEEMQKIHFKMRVATEALSWFGQAINAGEVALAQIQNEERIPE